LNHISHGDQLSGIISHALDAGAHELFLHRSTCSGIRATNRQWHPDGSIPVAGQTNGDNSGRCEKSPDPVVFSEYLDA
jgi:hypothetical protein